MVHSRRAEGGEGLGARWAEQKRIDVKFGDLGKVR